MVYGKILKDGDLIDSKLDPKKCKWLGFAGKGSTICAAGGDGDCYYSGICSRADDYREINVKPQIGG